MNQADPEAKNLPAATGAGQDIEDNWRDLDQRLPGLIETAFRHYRDFAGKEPPTESRAFAAYSSACRAALVHLEQLLKLARLPEAPAPGVLPPAQDLDRLIADAEAALEKAATDT